MRTSEVSDAGALGFRAGKDQAAKRFPQISLVVAATAFLSAALFVTYDISQTLAPPSFVTATGTHPIEFSDSFIAISRAAMFGEDRPALATPQVAEENTLAGLAGRGMIAFTLAGFITLTASRRRDGQDPDQARREVERQRTEAALATIREEQRKLARQYHEEKLKAEAANRAKTNFLAHVSHDIRTPLNHIIGFAELMEHETYGQLGDERYRDYVQSIKTSGQHLLHSFATILDLVELEGGQKALRQDIVLVDEVIDSVVRRFQNQITRAGLRFKIGAPTGAVLRGDRLGLVRMVGNMVDNAIRFTHTGGTIALTTYAAEDGVVIEISDTGIGMSEERLASLSQPFALGDATFTRDGHGPGLGISIARAIAEQSGGHLVIDSAPSLGTTVAISLPTEPAAAELAA
ncbi:sensor histidine kinase [Devosia chinhatensis]|nr:HAMP domain-containing sensor histidine kinase [Devosia chinhatensis]